MQTPRSCKSVCVTWFIHLCDMTRVCVVWDMINSHVWHDWSKIVIFRQDSCVCDVTHLRVTALMYVWRDSTMCDSVCVTWFIHLCDMAHVCVGRD